VHYDQSPETFRTLSWLRLGARNGQAGVYTAIVLGPTLIGPVYTRSSRALGSIGVIVHCSSPGTRLLGRNVGSRRSKSAECVGHAWHMLGTPTSALASWRYAHTPGHSRPRYSNPKLRTAYNSTLNPTRFLVLRSWVQHSASLASMQHFVLLVVFLARSCVCWAQAGTVHILDNVAMAQPVRTMHQKST
jgi:hypothetical protein